MKRFLLLLWAGWKKFAHVLGLFNTRVILTITYFVLIALVAIVSRLFRADFLDKRKRKEGVSYWYDREPVETSLEACRRQF